MKRVWHPYHLWEDWINGMWTPLHGQDKKSMLEKAIVFTGNHIEYGRWMKKVIVQWPIACEHNLTSMQTNKLAWIGHAATSLAIKCPEMITREAWGMLTQQQRDLADHQAMITLDLWTKNYERKDSFLGNEMAIAGIPQWDSGRGLSVS